MGRAPSVILTAMQRPTADENNGFIYYLSTHTLRRLVLQRPASV